jgi:hypothetical protein
MVHLEAAGPLVVRQRARDIRQVRRPLGLATGGYVILKVTVLTQMRSTIHTIKAIF